jgi:opacity protein-like surface antigen
MKTMTFITLGALTLGVTHPLLADTLDDKGAYIAVKGGGSFPNRNPRGSFQNTKLRNGAPIEVGAGYHFGCVDTDIAFIHVPHYKLRSHSVGNDINTAGFNFTHASKVQTNTWILSGRYNLTEIGIITPYLGVGAGMSWNKLKDSTVTYSTSSISNAPFKIKHGATNTDFAWQVMAGAKFRLNPNLSFITEYKYMDLGKMKTSNRYTVTTALLNTLGEVVQDPVSKGKLRSSNVMVGLRYQF